MKNRKYYICSFISLICLVLIGYELVIKDPCICIPVTFSKAKIPVVKGRIDKKEYALKLDLGSPDLDLDKNELDNLKKEFNKIKTWEDIFGNEYESASYIISNFRIQDLKWKSIVIYEDDPNFHANTSLWKPPNSKPIQTQKTFGSIGRLILQKTNLLLDFPHNKMYACNSSSKLKKKNYHINDWIAVPFEERASGIIIEIDTDFGLKKFIFDTGCTAIFIQPKCIDNQELWKEKPNGFLAYTTSKFKIGSHNFSNIQLYQLQLSGLFEEIDGALGMNFIEDYQIYIDYPNKMMFINPVNFNP